MIPLFGYVGLGFITSVISTGTLAYCCPPPALSVCNICSCSVGQEGKFPLMWAFLIFLWLLVRGWGFFYSPLWYNIYVEWGNILSIGRCVSRVLSAVFIFARKPGIKYLLRSSLCAAHTAAACKPKVQEHSEATEKSSWVEPRGAAGFCGRL